MLVSFFEESVNALFILCTSKTYLSKFRKKSNFIFQYIRVC